MFDYVKPEPWSDLRSLRAAEGGHESTEVTEETEFEWHGQGRNASRISQRDQLA
jgi:hypothetical protein